MDRLAPSESDQHSYFVNGKLIYKWDQTLTEVNLYIEVPPGVGSKQLDITIAPRHVAVGIKGNPPYLDKDLGGLVKVGESFWTVEGGVLHIELTKAEEATTWASAIAGHELAEIEKQADQKRLMLERFQSENPGFDFSNAEFTGNVPDPRTFMRNLGQND